MKMENLAGNFFAGEIDEALVKVIQLDDLGSVVNLKASLQYTHSISIEQQYMAKIKIFHQHFLKRLQRMGGR